jgi:hypothetical protein
VYCIHTRSTMGFLECFLVVSWTGTLMVFLRCNWSVLKPLIMVYWAQDTAVALMVYWVHVLWCIGTVYTGLLCISWNICVNLSGPLPSQYYTWGYYPDRPSNKTQHKLHVGALGQEKGVRHRAKNSRSEVPPNQSQYCQHLTWPRTRRDERGGYLERIKLKSTSARK